MQKLALRPRDALKTRVWPRRVAPNHEGQRVTDKTDRTSVGLFATGATSGASVVYHLDRFARDLAATLDYLRRFARRGVELHVVGRGRVEADTASGFIVTAVEGLATEHYRRVISEKTRDALARLRPSGSMSGTPSSATMQRTGVHRDHPLELSAPDKGLDTGWTSSQDQAAILPGAGY